MKNNTLKSPIPTSPNAANTYFSPILDLKQNKNDLFYSFFNKNLNEKNLNYIRNLSLPKKAHTKSLQIEQKLENVNKTEEKIQKSKKTENTGKNEEAKIGCYYKKIEEMKNNITQKTQRTERISSESSNFKLIQNEKEEAFQNFLQSSNSTKKCPDYSSDKVLLTYPDTTRNSSAIGKASDDENEEKIIKQIFSVDIKTQKSENFIEFLDSYISYFDEKRSKKNSESIFNGEKKKIKDESSKYKEKIDAAKIIQKKNQREIEIFKIKEKCYIKVFFFFF